MGSLSGSSKAPSRPVEQVIYVPTPSYETPSSSSGEPSEEEKLQERAESVLKRSRSRLGTILTGFRGVLSQNDLIAPRKTLLGE
ncbi:MAG: hypothetical protein DI586_02465 [Micavibrio aeruginosavorus]|uniref:Uncharacterized protein n=1 Tax=Micavibrio aeruginosavorus TaxID=349221 RepID=A0A2W5FSI0_9BACT|nr:MAG: hypothetical protein DI586_02465 [Micavibrio aeruginosavorus]